MSDQGSRSGSLWIWKCRVGDEGGETGEDEVRVGVGGIPNSWFGSDVLASNCSTSIADEVSPAFPLTLSFSSFLNSTLIILISVEDDEVILISISQTKGTRALLYKAVINLGNEREVYYCLSLIKIFRAAINLRFSYLWSIIHPTSAALWCQRIDSFYDNIRLQLKNPNEFQSEIFNSFFLIMVSSSSHVRTVLLINGANHPLKSSKVLFLILSAKSWRVQNVHRNISLISGSLQRIGTPWPLPDQLLYVWFSPTLCYLG